LEVGPKRLENTGTGGFAAPQDANMAVGVLPGTELVALFPATSEREKISFHQLNKETGHRIKYKRIDAETGDEVESTDIVKGYEVGKGEYIELDPEELEAVAIESKRTIDIDEFVPRDEIDELYLNNPYYIAPGWKSRPADIRCDPGSNPQRGHGRNR
jgi:hypothetical protein